MYPVPEAALVRPGLGPPPHHLQPTSAPLPPFSSSASSTSPFSPSGNGKRASFSSQLPTQTPPPQPLPSASARYLPREVPPRFRQQEHKQLLKRGQPLPAGALGALVLPSSSSSTPSSPSPSYPSSSSTTASSAAPNSATSAEGSRHPGSCLERQKKSSAGFCCCA